MTLAEAIRIVEDTEIQYNRDRKQDFLNGLILLSKYDNNITPQFEHDVCYLSDFEETATKMTEDELVQMKQYGFLYDANRERWEY